MQELTADIRIKRAHSLREGLHLPVAAEARLGVTVQFPAMTAAGQGARGAAHRHQVVILGEFEDEHAAVRLPVLRLLDIQDLVAVAHPGGPTLEVHVRESCEGFLLAGHLLQGRRQQLAEDDLDADQQHPSDEYRNGEPGH